MYKILYKNVENRVYVRICVHSNKNKMIKKDGWKWFHAGVHQFDCARVSIWYACACHSVLPIIKWKAYQILALLCVIVKFFFGKLSLPRAYIMCLHWILQLNLTCVHHSTYCDYGNWQLSPWHFFCCYHIVLLINKSECNSLSKTFCAYTRGQADSSVPHQRNHTNVVWCLCWCWCWCLCIFSWVLLIDEHKNDVIDVLCAHRIAYYISFLLAIHYCYTRHTLRRMCLSVWICVLLYRSVFFLRKKSTPNEEKKSSIWTKYIYGTWTH